jgi:hypothetical protein
MQPAPHLMLPNGTSPMLPPLIDGRPAGVPMINIDPRTQPGAQPVAPGTAPAPGVPQPLPPTDQNPSRSQ